MITIAIHVMAILLIVIIKEFTDKKIACKDSIGKIIWYMGASDLNGLGMMQKLPYKELNFVNNNLEVIIKTDDNRDCGCSIVCDIEGTDETKEETGNYPLMPDKRKVVKEELGYIKIKKGFYKSEKFPFSDLSL